MTRSSLTRRCTWRCLSALWAINLFVVGACTPGGDAVLTDQDLDALDQMTQAWLDAHADRDWNTLAGMYTDDAVLMPPFSPIIQGRENIRDWFAVNDQYTSIEATNLEIDGYGDLAYVRGRLTATMSPPGQEAFSSEGKFLSVRHRDSAGAWRVSVEAFSPDEVVQ